MQTRVFPALGAAFAILAPFAAQAGGFAGQARLARAAAAPIAVNINGVDWKCDADACLGAADHDQGLDGFMRECRKVSAAVGPLVAYASNGRVMTAGNVAVCNRLADSDRARQLAAK